jgi:plastocyanin
VNVTRTTIRSIAAALVLTGLAACGGEKPEGRDNDDHDQAPAANAAPGVPAPTGTVIEIKAITDDQGNRFEPADIEAKPGDVLRIVLVTGVHNISFPAEKNPGAQGLPAPSDMLQLPGQTHDVPITFAPGDYAFQCDPHAALGMVGKLEVEDD